MKRRKIIILIMVIVIAVLLIYTFTMKDSKRSGYKPSATVVSTTKVTLADMPTQVYALSALKAINVANIASEISGTVQSIHFNDGAVVPEGELLIQLDSESQVADLKKAKAEASLAELDYNRINSLIAKGAISKQEMDKADSHLQVVQANQAIAQATFDKTQIRAPFAGNLGERLVSVGEYVDVGQNLVNIVDKRKLKLQFSVPERYLPQLTMGSPVSFNTQAFPGEVFIGSIDFISPSIDPSTRTILIEALFDNQNEHLSPGLSGQAALVLAINQNAMRIPEEAILPTITGYQVYRIVNNHAQMRPIEIGSRSGGYVHVLSGIESGDEIVVRGQESVRDGAPVEVLVGGK